MSATYALGLLGIVVVLFLLLTIVFRAEKRAVWPFGELEAAPAFGDPSGYATRWVNEATQAGWRMLGWARHLGSGTAAFRVNYAIMVSPQHDTIAVIGTGTVFERIPLRATWLWTPTAEGRTVYSTDNQSGVQIDLSHDWKGQLAPAPAFDLLVAQHQAWMQGLGVMPAGQFTPGHEFAELLAMRQEHFRAMERAGLICYADALATHFHFTFWGAARTATWSYLVGMLRRLTGGRIPRTA